MFSSHTIFVASQWTNEGNQAYDYGAIILSNAIDGVGQFGFTSLSDSDLQSLLVTILGYPAENTPDHETMWGDQGFLLGVSPTQIYYGMQTVEGMSGGPVFYTVGNDRYVVGIHNYGGDSPGNFATRITEPIANDITAWASGG